MSFDEWKERQESLGNEVDSWSAWVFQQSKIDELQKRIDELERGCRSYKNQRDDYAEKLTIKTIHYNSIVLELGELKDRVQSAYHVATQSTWSSLKQLRKVVNILKGEK